MKNIVIDANIGISFVTPVPYSPWTIQRMAEWQQVRARIIVPTLWRYEVLSGLRKAITIGLLSEDKAQLAINQLRAMAFEEHTPSWSASLLILDWAKRIGQIVAYDAVYLAVAIQFDAELWTADKRLAQAARNAGVAWVHQIMPD